MRRLFVGIPAILMLPLIPAMAQQSRSCWFRDLSSPAKATAYGLCQQGAVWITTDGGAKWTIRDTGSKSALRALSFVDINRGLAVGDGGTMVVTSDGGKTWQAGDSGTKENLMDIGFAGEKGWAAGYNGTMLHSEDGGRTWSKQKTGTTQALENLFFLDAEHGWSVGWGGTILRTADGGKTWETIKTAAAQWSLSSIYFRDLQNGWIVGFAGQILRSKDSGKTWEVQPSPVRGWLTNVNFDAAGRGWITHDDGFLVSEDGGGTWKVVNTSGRFFLSRLQRVGDELWAVGQSALLRQAGSSVEWKRIEMPSPTSLTPPNAATAGAGPASGGTGSRPAPNQRP